MRRSLFIILVLVSNISYAQYFSAKEGTTLLYKTESFEKKKTKTSTDTCRIIDSYSSGDTLIVKQENIGRISGSIDGTEILTYRYTRDGITHLSLMNTEDGREILRESFFKNYQNPESEDIIQKDINEKDFKIFLKHIRCEGNIYLTLNPKAVEGDELPKSEFLYKMGPMRKYSRISKGVIKGFETLVTPAGTFKCLKVSYCVQYKIMFFSEKVYFTDWYAEDVGLVKRIETNKRGQIFLIRGLIDRTNYQTEFTAVPLKLRSII